VGVQVAGRGAPAAKVGGGQDRGGMGADRWAWATVPWFKLIQTGQIYFKKIQTVLNNFKSMQTLTDPKRTLPNSKILKQNMVVKYLRKGTTLSIGISSDSKWILN
jgi:hypothetical protein